MKKIDLTKNMKRLILVLGALLGAYLGLLLGGYLHDWIGSVTELQSWTVPVIYGVSLVVCAGVFTGISLPLVKGTIACTQMLDGFLKRFTSQEIVGGMIGIVLGAMVAFLFCSVFNGLGNAFVSTTVLIFAFLLFCIMGMLICKNALAPLLVQQKQGENVGNAKILDSSAIIDGRIVEVCKAGFCEGRLIVPCFVLNELKAVADSRDLLKRNRGRRGLDIVKTLQKTEGLTVEIDNTDFPDVKEMETKLLKLAEQRKASLVTNDYNLNKVAQVMNLTVLNLNELSNAVKPIMLPGEVHKVKLVKEGKEGQGVGFREDGTMIVVENGGNEIGNTVDVTITTSIQTNTGLIIFGRIM